MNLTLTTASIDTRLTGDTGAGGLFASGAELVTGHYWKKAPPLQADALPYIVSNVVTVLQSEPGFNHDGLLFQWQTAAYVSAETGALSSVYAIMDRLYKRLNRWTPTPPTGWTAGGAAVHVNTIDNDDLPVTYGQVADFEVRFFLDQS